MRLDIACHHLDFRTLIITREPTIERKTRQRIVTVSITPYNIPLGELASNIQTQVIDQLDIPQGVTIRLAGDYEDQQETFGKMILLGALIILLVYIVMASQFESFIKPFVIMFTIPFALSGVIMALWMTGRSVDMIGALGLIMLVGIVVKNGIVLIDYIDLLRERGIELNKAIVMAGKVVSGNTVAFVFSKTGACSFFTLIFIKIKFLRTRLTLSRSPRRLTAA